MVRSEVKYWLRLIIIFIGYRKEAIFPDLQFGSRAPQYGGPWAVPQQVRPIKSQIAKYDLARYDLFKYIAFQCKTLKIDVFLQIDLYIKNNLIFYPLYLF